MRRRFVHLGINPVGAFRPGQMAATYPPGHPAPLQNYLTSLGGDWYRYASQNYVLWTSVDLATLVSQIAALSGYQSVYVLATEMAPIGGSSNGWMPPEFWQWMRKPRVE